MSSNRLVGMHIHSLTPEVYSAVGLLQPPGVIVMDPTPQWIRDIHDQTEGGCYIGVRAYEHGVVFHERNPIEWADHIAAMCGNALHLVGGAITYNEPLPRGHDDHEMFPRFDTWQAEEIARLQDVHDIDALAFPFGTGQFTSAPDRVNVAEVFPESCEVCRVMSPHDYDWPNIWLSEGWRAMRWLQWLDDIEAAGFGRKRVIVSEWGLTQATYGGEDIGWRSGVSQEDYLRQIDEYNARLCGIPEAEFFAPFNWGGIAFGWESFEHIPPGDDSVVREIFTIACPEIPEPEPEPNGGSEMDLSDIRVFAIDEDTEQMTELTSLEDKEALVFDKYGAAFRRAEVESGQKVYRLTELWEKSGPASLVTQVLNEDGSPIADKSVAFYWPGAPDPPDPPTEVYAHDWYHNFVHGPTNVNGDVGPGMGPGAYHGKGEGGPHAVWVRDLNIPSDICEKLGMLAGTPHDHLDQKFQLMVGGENGGGEGELTYDGVVEEGHPSSTLGIALPIDYSVEHDVRGDGRGPGVDDTVHPISWTHPTKGDMALVEICADYSGEEGETREYTIQALSIFSGAYLTEKHARSFGPLGTPRKRIVHVYTLDGEIPPPPPPPPIPGDPRSAKDVLDDLEEAIAEFKTVIDNITVDTSALVGLVEELKGLIYL